MLFKTLTNMIRYIKGYLQRRGELKCQSKRFENRYNCAPYLVVKGENEDIDFMVSKIQFIPKGQEVKVGFNSSGLGEYERREMGDTCTMVITYYADAFDDGPDFFYIFNGFVPHETYWFQKGSSLSTTGNTFRTVLTEIVKAKKRPHQWRYPLKTPKESATLVDEMLKSLQELDQVRV